ncbi:MAG TPA: acetyl-CoA synthetase [Ruminococcaceae bacterium]|nr:acetyl-CoA synthetase [Oscillospiraceae bacterium]
MGLLERYLDRIDFNSYEDFKQNYKLNVPEKFNFAYDIVDEWAKIDKNKPALLWCNDEGDEKSFTFNDLKILSDKAANFFRSLGIEKGDTVMMMLKQRPEAWICILALCKLGAICIPATYQLTPKDIEYRCNSADVKMIVAVDDDEIIKHISLSVDKCKALKHIAIVGDNIPDGYINFRKHVDQASEFFSGPNKEISNSDTMLIYFSSGTTGMPKMIKHDFTYPLGHIVTAKYWQKVEDGGLHLTMSDSGWAKFAWGKIFGQWICGAVIVAYDNEKFDPHKTLEVINRLRLTTFCAPPTIYRFLIKEDLSVCDFSSLKHCSIAGEPLNPEVFNRFKEATGLEVAEGFGQSETTVILANFSWFPIKPGSTGKPSPLYDIDIVDEDGNSCEDGIVGSIVIRNTDKAHPVGLFNEYYKDDAANEKAWKNNMYNTGDTAWRDADGYYWFVGRNDDVIKCSGYRIGPFEVESALLTHPSVLECAITAVPDPIRGQVVKATVVLAKGYTASDELKKELQTHVKNVTAPYKYPRVIEFVSELPKTISGKIKRVEIRQEDAKPKNNA